MMETQFSYDKNICIDIPNIKTGRCFLSGYNFLSHWVWYWWYIWRQFSNVCTCLLLHDYFLSIMKYIVGYGSGIFFPFRRTVYPKKYAHGFCFAVLCCGYTLTDFPISIRLSSLALWQSNDCPSASKATLMNMDKYFMWIHYERLHNHNKAKHNKTVCIFLGVYCILNLV